MFIPLRRSIVDWSIQLETHQQNSWFWRNQTIERASSAWEKRDRNVGMWPWQIRSPLVLFSAWDQEGGKASSQEKISIWDQGSLWLFTGGISRECLQTPNPMPGWDEVGIPGAHSQESNKLLNFCMKYQIILESNSVTSQRSFPI